MKLETVDSMELSLSNPGWLLLVQGAGIQNNFDRITR